MKVSSDNATSTIKYCFTPKLFSNEYIIYVSDASRRGYLIIIFNNKQSNILNR